MRSGTNYAVRAICLVFLIGSCGPASCGPNPFNDFDTPDEATGFTAVATSETTVRLSWDVVEGAYAYMLERRSGADGYTTIAAPTELTYEDPMLEPDTEYSYRLRTFGLSGGQSAGVEVTVRTLSLATGPKSSFDLIEEAAASFQIDRETKVRYKAFALFQDPRLPAQYRGNDTEVLETDVFDEILETWAATSPAGKAILEPFLVPPAYVGSWASPAPAAAAAPGVPFEGSDPICDQPMFDPNWAAKPATTGGRVKVWYDTRVAGENTRAQTLQAALENEAWPRLIDTLGMRAPLSDGLIAGCNGGDGRLDVYLTHMATKGQKANDYGANRPIDHSFKYRPVYLLINHNLPDNELKGTGAHELFHASQWAYPLAGNLRFSYQWLKEATAHWAVDYVYPLEVMNFEQKWAKYYFQSPEEQLDLQGEGKANRVYGSYLFFQFIARTTSPSIIKNIWDTAVSQSDELLAVDSTIPGGFENQWPKFAKYLWNQEPVIGSSFATWDALTQTPTLFSDNTVSLAGQPGVSAPLDDKITHLSIQYYRFKFNDPQIRSVGFLNHFFAINNVDPYKVSVQAFVSKVGTPWVWEDWSDEGALEQVKPFCFDVANERLDELVIVISNDSPKEDVLGGFAPRLALSNVGCWRFDGSSSVTTKATSTSTGEMADATGDATVLFERAPPDPSVPAGNTVLFWVKQGAVTGSSTNVGTCTTTQNVASSPVMTDGSITVNLGLDFGLGAPSRDVFMSGGSSLQTASKMVCPNVPDINATGPHSWTWLEDPVTSTAVVLPNGKIQGNEIQQLVGDLSGTKTVIWNFTPLKQ